MSGISYADLALEKEYWEALEELALEDGWHNWRDFFYVNILPNRPVNVSLASFARKAIIRLLILEYRKTKSHYVGS